MEKNTLYNPTCIHDKNYQQIVYGGKILQHNKDYIGHISQKSFITGNIVFKLFLIQYSTPSVSHSKRTRDKIKTTHLGKKEVELSLFADNMVLYIENNKPQPKTTQLNKFSKIAGDTKLI